MNSATICLAVATTIAVPTAWAQSPLRQPAFAEPDGSVHAQVFPGTHESGDPFISPDTVLLGGMALAAGAQITLRGQPYGYYDTGALFSLVSTSLPVSSSRAGINGGFEAGTAAMAAYADFDMVGLYDGVGSAPPLLTLTGVTYDATHIYPAAGSVFSAAQLARLRRSMWVMTNSIDPSIPTTPPAPGLLTLVNTYGSTVVSWTERAITVSGWTVPGSGHAAPGQIPPAANPARAYFASPTKQFARNTVMINQPGNPDFAGSQTRAFEAEEVDMDDLGTTDFGASWHGYTVHYTPAGIVHATSAAPAHNVLPTTDSYGVSISGPLPVLLQLRGVGERTWEIDADSLRLAVGQSPAPLAGSRSLLADEAIYIDSNRAHLLTYAVRDTAGVGPEAASLHLALSYDNTFGVLDGTGTQMGQIVWNPPGLYGGLRLCAAGGACGFGMAVGGAVTLPNGLTAASIETTGHIAAPSPDAPHLFACGPGASLAPASSDTRGIIVLGPRPTRECTLTFAKPFNGTMGQPICTFTPMGAVILVRQVAADANQVSIALAPPAAGGRVSYICLE